MDPDRVFDVLLLYRDIPVCAFLCGHLKAYDIDKRLPAVRRHGIEVDLARGIRAAVISDTKKKLCLTVCVHRDIDRFHRDIGRLIVKGAEAGDSGHR